MANDSIARMPTADRFHSNMMPLAAPVSSRAFRMLAALSVDDPEPHAGDRLMLHGPGSPRRLELESFVVDQYRQHFAAKVTQFMPTFLALHDARDRICAAVGCRSAAAEPLFLEIYTEATIEDLIARRAGRPVPREQIVEIGSLACRSGRGAMAIVRALVPYLIDAGFTWVAFTGTDAVVNVLKRLRLEPLALCAADSGRLGAARHAWGTYYEHDPIVMAGRLLDAVDALDSIPSVQ